MKINTIVAMDKNGLIGNKGKLPWQHISFDMKRFRNTTMGGIVVMGKITYESVGRNLPGRVNVILTRQLGFNPEGCKTVRSLNDLSALIDKYSLPVYCIGGAQIYELLLPYTHTLIVTRIHEQFQGNTYFPPVDWTQWSHELKWDVPKGEKSPYDLTIEIWKR